MTEDGPRALISNANMTHCRPGSSVGKIFNDQRAADTRVSQNHESRIKASPETPRTTQHHGTERLKGSSQLGFHYAERRYSESRYCFFFSVAVIEM